MNKTLGETTLEQIEANCERRQKCSGCPFLRSKTKKGIVCEFVIRGIPLALRDQLRTEFNTNNGFIGIIYKCESGGIKC